MFKQQIADSDGTVAAVNADAGEDVGVVVAARDLKTFTPDSVFFTNSTYGREMNQDAAFGGTPLLIHNGTDDVAWTFSEPVGTRWVEDATDQFHAGTKSMKDVNSNVNDIMQVINNIGPGDNIDMTANYVALTMWIRVGSDWVTGDSVSIYAHVDGAPVGDKVLLEDYFPFSNYNDWHFINIPLTDMSLEAATLDAFRVEIESRAGAKSPTFWLDEINLQESGAAIEFTIDADKGTWFHVTSFQTIFVDAVSADNADSTMHQLSYNQILALTLNAGYKYERYSDGEIDDSFNLRITSLADLLSCTEATITNAYSDGTNTSITVLQKFAKPIVLKAENIENITITIEDGFDALLMFRICAQGYVEER